MCSQRAYSLSLAILAGTGTILHQALSSLSSSSSVQSKSRCFCVLLLCSSTTVPSLSLASESLALLSEFTETGIGMIVVVGVGGDDSSIIANSVRVHFYMKEDIKSFWLEANKKKSFILQRKCGTQRQHFVS